MASNYDTVDLVWHWCGDYSIGTDGDLADTKDDHLTSLKQDVHTIAASSLQDWENYPGLGATLDDFLGEPNNQATAAAVHDRLKISLISANVVEEEDLAIRVIPVHANKVLIVIGISAIPTAFNSLDEDGKIVTSLVFDTMEQQVFFLDRVPVLLP